MVNQVSTESGGRRPLRQAQVLVLMVFVDTASVYVLHRAWAAECDASTKLKAWLIGGLLLGWPSSMAVRCAAKHSTFRRGVAAELLFFACSFAWLAAGSSWSWGSVNCAIDAPILFWPVFISTIFVWITLFASMSLLFLGTVVTALPKSALKQ
eukprot:TRINITY_DN54734_c0_g1_i1.p1 TRINITY_DN54734_c0_g1~~TRINITY_DN54734_c0_g1_i1.p1  ORF type:complete len:153 (+),score=24.43 TRINITY_DN54734_c0_g1_i1:88-546(+)